MRKEGGREESKMERGKRKRERDRRWEVIDYNGIPDTLQVPCVLVVDGTSVVCV